MHIGGGQFHVTQDRGLVGPTVFRFDRDVVAPYVRHRRFERLEMLGSHVDKYIGRELYAIGRARGEHGALPAQPSVMELVIGEQRAFLAYRVTGDAAPLAHEHLEAALFRCVQSILLAAVVPAVETGVAGNQRALVAGDGLADALRRDGTIE